MAKCAIDAPTSKMAQQGAWPPGLGMSAPQGARIDSVDEMTYGTEMHGSYKGACSHGLHFQPPQSSCGHGGWGY